MLLVHVCAIRPCDAIHALCSCGVMDWSPEGGIKERCHHENIYRDETRQWRQTPSYHYGSSVARFSSALQECYVCVYGGRFLNKKKRKIITTKPSQSGITLFGPLT